MSRFVKGGVDEAWTVATPSRFAVRANDLLLDAAAYRRADLRPDLCMYDRTGGACL